MINQEDYEEFKTFNSKRLLFYFLIKKGKEFQDKLYSLNNGEEHSKEGIFTSDEEDCFNLYIDTMRYIFYFLTNNHIIKDDSKQNLTTDYKNKQYAFTITDPSNQSFHYSFSYTEFEKISSSIKCNIEYIKEFEQEALQKIPVIRYMFSLKNKINLDDCLKESEYESIAKDILREFLIDIWIKKEETYKDICKKILFKSEDSSALKIFSYTINDSQNLNFINLELGLAILISIYRTLFYKLIKTGNSCYLAKNKSYKSIIDKFYKKFPEKKKIDLYLLEKYPQIVAKEKEIALDKILNIESLINPQKQGSKLYIFDDKIQELATKVIKSLSKDSSEHHSISHKISNN
jgi:hypothetical protein